MIASVDSGQEYPALDPSEYPLLRERLWLAPGELLSAISAVVLLVSMFALGWYGVVGQPRGPEASGLSSAENAWHGLVVLRWLMLATIFCSLGSLALHAAQRSLARRTQTAPLLLGLAALTAASLIYRVLVDPPSSAAVVDVKLGGFVGLLASIGIAVGGLEALRGERALRSARARRDVEKLPSPGTPR